MSLRALRNSIVVLIGVAALLWVVTPLARTGELFIAMPGRHAPSLPAGLHVTTVQFPASDGTHLQGWMVRGTPDAPAIVLVPGFKEDRSSMVPYARMLHHAGYAVLLYDLRGTGASGGTFGLGLREVDDVAGALSFLHGQAIRHVGILGVSLGSGGCDCRRRA